MTYRTEKLAGAILAGGLATRYGGAVKGDLDAGGGRTILQRLLAELAAAGIDEVIVSANDPARYASLGRPVVADLRPGLGPLGGIEAVLAHHAGRFNATVLLPCDLPGITAAQIGELAAAFRGGQSRIVVAETGDSFRHPLCSVVHNGLLPDISAALDAGELSVGRLWHKLGAAAVRFDDQTPFFNVNTPQDLANWHEGIAD